MKIAQIICTFPPYKGGMGNSAWNISARLANGGDEVTVFTPKYKKISEEETQKFKIIRLFTLLKFGNAAFLPQLFWRLKNYDIVDLHYPFYGAAGIVLLRKIFFKKMKLVVHYHMDNVGSGIKGLVYKANRLFILPLLIKNAEVVVSASLDYVEHSSLKYLYAENKNKFIEIPFGVDCNKFIPGPFNSNKKNILFVAGLDKAHYFKGLENLLTAFNRVRKTINKETYLNIIGSGDMADYYQGLINNSDLEENARIFRNVKDIELINYYRECDLFVLPSINKGEAFGLVLLEAMASGKPVIASDLPGVRKVFRNEIDGLLVKTGDIDDLAQKIKILLDDDAMSISMGAEGRKLAEAKYDWEAVVGNLKNLYKKLINK